uniref:Uncharacterized protein n=1 Tax=Hucho hucho TaxID=62062 RepID=A0A4W5RSX2_9TELE
MSLTETTLIVASRCVVLQWLAKIGLNYPWMEIDILINNGGRSQRSLSLETSVDVYQVLMEHNFLGTVSFTKQVLPHMMQRGSCSVVTVSSTPGNRILCQLTCSSGEINHGLPSARL